MVEFYKDDTSRKCAKCGKRFVNPRMDFGCASYCQFAEQCLGTLPEEFIGQQDNLLKDKVAVEMKRHYRADFKSIRIATAVARYAEQIGKQEGGSMAVILCAAYLNGIGRKQGRLSGAGYSPQEQEASRILAEQMLKRLAAKDGVVDPVLAIVGGEDRKEGQLERNVVQDAEQLAWLDEQCHDPAIDPAGLEAQFHARLSLPAGVDLARALLHGRRSHS